MKRLFLCLTISLLLATGALAGDDVLIMQNNVMREVCLWLIPNERGDIYWPTRKNERLTVCYAIQPMWEIVTTEYDWDGNGQRDIIWRHWDRFQWRYFIWLMAGVEIKRMQEIMSPMGSEWEMIRK
jgi:hypothetical protein